MLTADERMLINAAIEKLIEGWDEEAAKTIIKYGHTLPKEKYTAEVKLRGRDQSTVTGHTQEAGNVSIDTKTVEDRVVTFGEKKERVGYYKLFKDFVDGRLSFHHYWASDSTTESSDPENKPTVYTLGYDTKTLSPLFFGKWGQRIVFELRNLSIIQHKVVVIWGQKPRRHKISYQVVVNVYR